MCLLFRNDSARNYKELLKDIETYGIDESTDRAIRDIQTLRTDKERVRRFIGTLKQEGARTYNREDSRIDGQQRLDTSNRARINGDSLANFESEGLALYATPQGEVYGFVDKDGASEFSGEWIQFGSERFPDWDSIVSYMNEKDKNTENRQVTMAKRILVVPDVHGRTFWRSPIKQYLEEVDRIIFLGDYLDPYQDEDIECWPDELFDNFKKIIELKQKYEDKVVLLKGNHDQHYCSRYFYEWGRGSRCDKTHWKKYHLTFSLYRDLFQLAHIEQVNDTPYVFSHAGLTQYWLNKVNMQLWHLKDEELSIADPKFIDRINLLDDDEGKGQELLSVIGEARTAFYGEETGSILWADIEEHPINYAPELYGLNKVFQVFGHTRLDVNVADMVKSNHLALIDSRQCFMIDGELEENIVPLKYYDVIKKSV